MRDDVRSHGLVGVAPHLENLCHTGSRFAHLTVADINGDLTHGRVRPYSTDPVLKTTQIGLSFPNPFGKTVLAMTGCDVGGTF